MIEHHTNLYTTHLPVYSGPLDLLLKLIESSELDITKIALALVTDQYLVHIKNLADHSSDDISEFLVIASKLLQIKSEALLPRPPIRDEGEEDPAELLALQLIAYKRYKQISEFFEQRIAAGLRTYVRLTNLPIYKQTILLEENHPSELVDTLQILATSIVQKPTFRKVVDRYRVTIRDRITHILQKITDIGRTTFHTLISDTYSRLDVVVTFLALLELIKRNRVNASQAFTFGDIEVEAGEKWSDTESIVTEFLD